MRLLTRSAAVSAAATALILTTAPYASAGTSFEVFIDAESKRECDSVNESGSASFKHKGEHIYVKDRRADYAGVGVQVEVDGKVRDVLKNTKGNGTTVHYNRSYAEGAKVTLAVYRRGAGSCGYDKESGTA